MVELFQEWQHRDGESTFIIEEQLFDEMLRDPNHFYEVMVEDSTGFARYVEFLPSGVFTNFGDGDLVPELETKRQKALETLRSADIADEYSSMHGKVLSMLTELTPRNVD
jgi:hypothetical protein